jgi:hypothetical protein
MTRTINFVKMDDAGWAYRWKFRLGHDNKYRMDGVGQNCIPMGHQRLFLEISSSLTAAVSG